MGVHQRDTGPEQRNTDGPPSFRVVRRGYDPEQVDAYMPQLLARLEEAVDRYAKAERARSELERENANLKEGSPAFEQIGAEAASVIAEAGRSAGQLVDKARVRADTIVADAEKQAEQIRADAEKAAQKALEQAREVADHIRKEVEQERAALYAETEQVREFRDTLLDNLARVHGDITGLLERTRQQRDEAPAVLSKVDGKAEKPSEPAELSEPS
ncbi:MAG TPA: DivIVA domain-containing protein [Actinomycetes bacterium]|jgi:DivIVA domain-containing protein